MQKFKLIYSKQLLWANSNKLLICMLIWWLLMQITQILGYIICPNEVSIFFFKNIDCLVFMGTVLAFIEFGFWMFFFIFFLVVLVQKELKPVLFALAMIFVIPLYNITFDIKLKSLALLHLQLFHSIYEAKVQYILTERELKKQQTSCYNNSTILLPKPKPIQFYHSANLFGAYYIIYDPSGDVMSKDPDKRKEMGLFFAGASHLTGNWYLGCFRD